MSIEKDYGEIICTAVDTIIEGRLANLTYDQTILCTVEDDSRRAQGQYKVSNGSTKFDAYSADVEYRKGDNVYVLIPRGDWNETKTITGKKKKDEQETAYNYKSPFEYLVDVQGNLIDNQEIAGLIANGNIEQIPIWSSSVAHGGYTRLGIQGQFQTGPFYDDTEYKHDLTVEEGSYGLRLDITAKLDGDNKETYSFYLDNSHMLGNTYNFMTYFQQERVFDISALPQITSMALYFYQVKDSFKFVNENEEKENVPAVDFLGSPAANNLFVKDCYITLGYDVREFENDSAVLYCLDGSEYGAGLTNSKNISLRWIHDFGEDNGLKVVSLEEAEKLGAEIRWYQYELGAASADIYSGVYWKRINENNVYEYLLEPDVGLAEEKIKVKILYDDQVISSNVLTFDNNREVVNNATLDAATALSIICEDGTYGNYRIYGLSNSLMNSKDSSVIRYFKVMFGGSALTEAEKITWFIPKNKSMIKINQSCVAAAGGEINTDWETLDDERYQIIRDVSGTEEQLNDETKQGYYINSYYSQSYHNNTVMCQVVKDGITYTATKELTFGHAGTSGTDVTFVLDFDNGVPGLTVENNQAVIVTARLYNHMNEEIDLNKYSIDWSVLNDDQNDNDIIISKVDETNYKRELKLKEDSWLASNLSSNYLILEATLSGFGDYNLEAFLPIPIRISDQYKYIDGPTNLIYNSMGYLDSYYSDPYVLYTETEEIFSGWGINTPENNDPYAPKIKSYTDGDDVTGITKYKLQPVNIYVKDTSSKVCVYCTQNNKVVWSQPLYIAQNRYPAAMVNEWNGELTIDKDNNAIMSAKMIAGKKENDNSFSGVMMGDWSSGTDVESGIATYTGIYGFRNGAASFGFRDDGTAFIGKSGGGRIEFDGTNSVIKSANYQNGSGMQLNLQSGQIDAHQFTLNAGTINEDNSIYLSTNINRDYAVKVGQYFTIKWDGSIIASAGKFTGEINASSGTITGTLEVTGKLSGGTIEGGTIEGGSISINDGVFEVSSLGKLTATNANITGTINATSGYLKTLNIKNSSDIALGSFGYILGDDGTSTTDCVGFSANTGYSLVLESGNHIRLSTGTSRNIYLATGANGEVKIMSNTLALDMVSQVKLPGTGISFGIDGIATSMLSFVSTDNNEWVDTRMELKAGTIAFTANEITGLNAVAVFA